jgi:hypothetical protein
MSVRPWSTLGILLFLVLVSAQPVSVDGLRPRDQSDSDSQDESNLPLQIGGIVGSYVIFDALVVVLLLVVGRRLRRGVQASNYSLDMVMLQPMVKPAISTDPSPISPASTLFPSPVKGRGGWNMSWSSIPRGTKTHASNNSVATVDDTVITADRRKAQEDLEMLYAAVMEHDAQKGSSAAASPVEEYRQPLSPARSPVGSPSPARSPAGSPMQSPRGYGQQQYQPPLSTLQETAPPTPRKSRSSLRLSKISNLSLFSPGSRSSTISNKLRSPRLSIRKLPISPPAEAVSYGDNQPPLTPRYYNPGPPPTAPLAPTGGYPFQSLNHAASEHRPAPLDLSNNSTSTLPFRQAYNPPQSAPPTKTTILDRPGNLPGYGGPRTGIPTPYSPYMPFTPVTPITPSRMVTKREKRWQEKMHGLRVLEEDDMVKSDDDIWGS